MNRNGGSSHRACAGREEVPVSEAAAFLRSGGWRLIDCREDGEHMVCRLDGAELMPLSRWDCYFPDAFPAKDEPLLVICHHGMRSLRLTRHLHAHGYARALSVAGGIDAWSREVDAAVPRY